MSADATENNEAGKRAGDGVARVHVLVCTECSGMLSLTMVSGDLGAGRRRALQTPEGRTQQAETSRTLITGDLGGPESYLTIGLQCPHNWFSSQSI